MAATSDRIDPTVFVAVAGGTCAGKSVLAETLQRRVLAAPEAGRCVLIGMDNFYPDRGHLDAIRLQTVDWESFAGLDLDLLREVLTDLLAGRPAVVPHYDPRGHRRIAARATRANPAPILILDGLHAITAQRLLSKTGGWRGRTLAVYVECPEDERRARRHARELTAATIGADFLDYWHGTVQDVFRREVEPQRHLSDIVVQSPFEGDDVERIYAALRRTDR
nr:hypothetical protein [Micromonospora sp. DSM 115978]